MHEKIFLFLILLLIPSYAYAQESETVNYDKCEYDMIHQNIYAPFYFHINHDPAISQTFKQRHDDNPNVSPFQRAPEGVEPGSATWFEFGSSGNATATYEFELGLEYLEQSDLPRPITIQLFSENNLMMEKKIYQEQSIGCIAFRVSATPPPHDFTSEEILAIAKLEFVGITKQYADTVNQNTDETRGLKIMLISTSLVVVGMIGFVILDKKMTKREMNDLKNEYNIRNNVLATSCMKLDVNIQNENYRLLKMEKDNQNMINIMINNFGNMLQKVQDSVESGKVDLNKLITDLRAEIGLIERDPESAKELAEITFADIEKHDSSNDCIILPKPVIPVQDIPEPTMKKVFNFDLSFLTDVVKSLPNIIKKEEPILSDVEKLKEKWSKMDNEELSKLYSEYNKKSIDELNKTGKSGKDYDYAMMLFEIINSRNTDVNKDG